MRLATGCRKGLAPGVRGRSWSGESEDRGLGQKIGFPGGEADLALPGFEQLPDCEPAGHELADMAHDKRLVRVVLRKRDERANRVLRPRESAPARPGVETAARKHRVNVLVSV